MSHLLFDNENPTYGGPADSNENTYDFFNRSSRQDVLLVKRQLEKWFSEYPEEEKLELKNRFKKSFYSSFYELFLYSLFKALGFSIKIHPKIDGTEKRPDFLISKNGDKLFVEAAVLSGKSNQESSEIRKRNEFYDNINKFSISGYFLEINELEFKTTKQPSTKRLKTYLMSEISKLNHQEIKMSFEKYGFSV